MCIFKSSPGNSVMHTRLGHLWFMTSRAFWAPREATHPTVNVQSQRSLTHEHRELFLSLVITSICHETILCLVLISLFLK